MLNYDCSLPGLRCRRHASVKCPCTYKLYVSASLCKQPAGPLLHYLQRYAIYSSYYMHTPGRKYVAMTAFVTSKTSITIIVLGWAKVRDFFKLTRSAEWRTPKKSFALIDCAKEGNYYEDRSLVSNHPPRSISSLTVVNNTTPPVCVHLGSYVRNIKAGGNEYGHRQSQLDIVGRPIKRTIIIY